MVFFIVYTIQAILLKTIINFLGIKIGIIAFLILFSFFSFLMYWGDISSKSIRFVSPLEYNTLKGQWSAKIQLILIWWYPLILFRRKKLLKYLLFPNSLLIGIIIASIINFNSHFYFFLTSTSIALVCLYIPLFFSPSEVK